MATIISHSPAETLALGEDWGRAAESGQVICLSGELGAGKTQLVKGVARGLGSPQPVHSPTFSLINIYRGGRLILFHLDFYRLETRAQIAAAGLEEYFSPQGVTVIEWPERWFSPPGTRHSTHDTRHSTHDTRHTTLDTPFRWVKIDILNENERRISYEDSGP